MSEVGVRFGDKSGGAVVEVLGEDLRFSMWGYVGGI
jgi:hypothetical protein